MTLVFMGSEPSKCSDYGGGNIERVMGDFVDSSATIMMVDGVPIADHVKGKRVFYDEWQPFIWYSWEMDWCSTLDGPNQYDNIPQHGTVCLRHNGGFNALFADGHVKGLRRSTWQMWAADPRQITPSDKTTALGCKSG
jgi:prepilin-type processing-associated H-X9-DG protein